jgi:hypothetical protein
MLVFSWLGEDRASLYPQSCLVLLGKGILPASFPAGGRVCNCAHLAH